MERQVREDRTLDYKGELRLDDSGKLDLLQDVVAMANASGGTIVYGAVEGTDEDRGRIAEIRPMSLAPDQLELQISNLLRDNVDERIANIEHRAIEFGKGYLYVIRIPASPRAPHMVTLPSRRPRFYMRATTSNDPMNAQQIREVAMRSETAYDRVREQITKRVEEVERLVRSRPGANREFLVLHFLPLFPPRGGVDLSSRDLYRRWYSVKPFGCEGSHVTVRMSLDGIAAESSVPDELYSSTVLLREGGLEFTQVAMAYPLAGRGGERVGPPA
jgi:hypothetical protein